MTLAQQTPASPDAALLQIWRDAMAALGAPVDDDRVVGLGRDLLTRWREPHRHYHGTTHLDAGLQALVGLGGRPVEDVAWWFHDAVHHNDPPWDEQKSAALARESLVTLLPAPVVAEVARLVLVTISHSPAADDPAGTRISDADLAPLAADWPSYQHTLSTLRRERGELNDILWQTLRVHMTGTLLNRPWLFHTRRGRTEWEKPARRNLNAERTTLFNPEEPTT